MAKRPKPDDDTSSSSRKHKHKQKVDIEELRRERRRREEAERARAEALMQRHHGVVVAPAQSVPEVVEELPGRWVIRIYLLILQSPVETVDLVWVIVLWLRAYLTRVSPVIGITVSSTRIL